MIIFINVLTSSVTVYSDFIFNDFLPHDITDLSLKSVLLLMLCLKK